MTPSVTAPVAASCASRRASSASRRASAASRAARSPPPFVRTEGGGALAAGVLPTPPPHAPNALAARSGFAATCVTTCSAAAFATCPANGLLRACCRQRGRAASTNGHMSVPGSSAVKVECKHIRAVQTSQMPSRPSAAAHAGANVPPRCMLSAHPPTRGLPVGTTPACSSHPARLSRAVTCEGGVPHGVPTVRVTDHQAPAGAVHAHVPGQRQPLRRRNNAAGNAHAVLSPRPGRPHLCVALQATAEESLLDLGGD
jgi:hypothetical protein